MRINSKEIRRKINKRYFGSVKLLEQTEGLSGVERVLSRGKCKVSMAQKICKILNIPFWKMWEA